MDSKIIVRILIVGLTTVLALAILSEKDFLKGVSESHESNSIKQRKIRI